jgi:hypothetical protein
MQITARRLPGGYWHVRGNGPCNWTQPPQWPCDAGMLHDHAFPQASWEFLRKALELAQKMDELAEQMELNDE